MDKIYLGCYEGISLKELVEQLNKIQKKNPSQELYVEIEQDYSSCYYEGDRPDVYLAIR